MSQRGLVNRPAEVIVSVGGDPAFTIPMATLDGALRDQQLADRSGSADTTDGLAKAARTSRTTISRCFSQGRVSLTHARRIVTALGLNFEEVATRIDDRRVVLMISPPFGQHQADRHVEEWLDRQGPEIDPASAIKAVRACWNCRPAAMENRPTSR